MMDERRRSLLFAFGGGVACGMVDGVEAAQQAGVCAASTSIDAKQFGAIGDGHSHPARERFATLSECRARYPHAASLDDQIDGLAIQAAIDDALYFSKSPIVRIPAGVYRLSRPLHLGYGVPYGGTPYTTASLEGDGYDYAQQGAGTTLITEYSDAPALCIQGARGSRWSGIAFRGRNAAWIATHAFWRGEAALDATQVANWIDPALARNGSSDTAPYAGVAIDPFSGPMPHAAYPSVSYPAWLGNVGQYDKASSSMVSGEHFLVDGFVVGVVVQPSGSSKQGDFVAIRRYWITNCAFGFSVGQSDARLSDPSDGYINQCHTALTNARHGRGQGKFGSLIKNLAMDRCIQWLDIATAAYPYAGPMTLQNCYGENIWRVGDFGSGATRDQSLALLQCEAKFSFQCDHVGYPASILRLGGTSSQLRIIGGTYRAYRTVFQIYAAGAYVGIDGAYFSPSMPSPTLSVKLLHSASAGGVFIFNGDPVTRPEAFCAKFDPVYGKDGSALERQAVIGRVHQGYRDVALCIHSGWVGGAGHRAVTHQVYPPSVQVDRHELFALSLSNGLLQFEWRGRSEAAWATYGPVVGDACLDLGTGTVFYVVARDGERVRAKQQNNYRIGPDGQKRWLVPIDLGTGTFAFVTGRMFSPRQYVRGDLSAASAVITGVGAADGSAGGIGSEIRAGDWLYSDPITEGYVHIDARSNCVVSVDARRNEIVLEGRAARTANGVWLSTWLIPSLASEDDNG